MHLAYFTSGVGNRRSDYRDSFGGEFWALLSKSFSAGCCLVLLLFFASGVLLFLALSVAVSIAM